MLYTGGDPYQLTLDGEGGSDEAFGDLDVTEDLQEISEREGRAPVEYSVADLKSANLIADSDNFTGGFRSGYKWQTGVGLVCLDAYNDDGITANVTSGRGNWGDVSTIEWCEDDIQFIFKCRVSLELMH